MPSLLFDCCVSHSETYPAPNSMTRVLAAKMKSICLPSLRALSQPLTIASANHRRSPSPLAIFVIIFVTDNPILSPETSMPRLEGYHPSHVPPTTNHRRTHPTRHLLLIIRERPAAPCACIFVIIFVTDKASPSLPFGIRDLKGTIPRATYY